MEKEWIKAALVALGLKDGATLVEVRAAYLDKTGEYELQQVILNDQNLQNRFENYYKAYITLLRHYSENDMETESEADLSYYPPDQLMRIHFNRGLYHLINKNYLKAMTCIEAAYKIDKKNHLVLNYMGIMLLKRKNLYGAEKYFKEVIKEDKENDDSWFQLGEVYAKTKDYKKALTMFETAKTLNPFRKDTDPRIRAMNIHLGVAEEDKTGFKSLFSFFKKK
ncbi:MAG: tetratricopeptide repeat protein [bacterium]|nr:tetratricopeptide repeat protein [bacterium]